MKKHIRSLMLISILGVGACQLDTEIQPLDDYSLLTPESDPVLIELPEHAAPLAAASAQPESIVAGDLDPSFDGDGIVLSQIYGFEGATAMVVQSNGRIVVASCAGDLQGVYVYVSRYNSNGSIDWTFANGAGFQATLITHHQACVYPRAALQSDGKIVLAFSLDPEGIADSSGDLILVRYTANGLLDTSFGFGGITVHEGPNQIRLGDIAIHPGNDKILIGNSDDYDGRFTVLRFTSNGHLDTTFGWQGSQSFHFGIDGARVFDITIQPDGKILLLGNMGSRVTVNEIALVRFTQAGAIDLSFGYQGASYIDLLGHADVGLAVKVQPDGRILVAGNTFYSPHVRTYMALVRLNAMGTALDSSFGVSGPGRTYLAVGTRDGSISRLVLQSDGKIVAASEVFSYWDPNTDMGLLRFNQNGTLDSSFRGGNGFVLDVEHYDQTADVALQADGKILVGGRGPSGTRISRHWN